MIASKHVSTSAIDTLINGRPKQQSFGSAVSRVVPSGPGGLRMRSVIDWLMSKTETITYGYKSLAFNA